MAEITYTGGGSRGVQPTVPQQQPQQQAAQRPSTASARLQRNDQGTKDARPHNAGRASTQHMLASLDFADRAAAKPPPVFPSPGSLPNGLIDGGAKSGEQAGARHRPRPQSAAQLRASGAPRLLEGKKLENAKPEQRMQFGRVSVFDHSTPELAPHEVVGPKVLRDLDKPRVGFPSRLPEDFLRAGEGLSLRQRNKLKEHLKRCPVNAEAPFVPGTGGVRLPPPLSFEAFPLPRTLLRTYYDNGTLDFVAVRWRGNRADALVWARAVTKGPPGSPHCQNYTAWAPEPPSELDVPTWLPIFLDGIREYDEPYKFLAIRGSEDLLYMGGGMLHTFADALVPPFRAALATREPTVVAVALQLMMAALDMDPRVAAEWAPHYWQFAQVINLFRSRGGALVVDMGYNKRDVASCRQLAATFMTAFEVAGGAMATAAVRRYSPGHDPAVTDASMARAAAKAAAKAKDTGVDPATFKPFTLF